MLTLAWRERLANCIGEAGDIEVYWDAVAFVEAGDEGTSMSSTIRSSSSTASMSSKSVSSILFLEFRLATLLLRLRSCSGRSHRKLDEVGVQAMGVPGWAPRIVGEEDIAGV